MRRTLLLLLALVLAAPFLAGCGDDGGSSGDSATSEDRGDDATGSDDEGEEPEDEESEEAQDLGGIELIRSAPAALEDAGTAHLEMTITATGQTIDATGEFDFEAQQGALTMTLPQVAGGGELETVFDGTTYFLSADAFGSAIPGLDAEWIRIDLAELADQTGIDPSQVPQGSSNPADALDALAAVSEDGLDEVGTEDVRGVETTHYAAEIDMAAAIEQANEDAGGELIDEQFADQFLMQFGDEPVPVEIWIDDEGLVHRQTMSFASAGQEVSLEMELFDYGEPVDIQVPDPSDAADFSELLGSIGSGTTPGG